ncbi:MAG: hypothetical protein HND49_02575 [Planctomycetes bacterium]|nr:hypothetical protein [Planctomycetota bacterium]
MFERKLPIYYVTATISKSSSTIVRSGYEIVTRLVPGHFSLKHRVFVQALNSDNEKYLIYIALVFFIILGMYFRFLGIDNWCLAVDEFFTASSVSRILEYGIPRFEHGGFYVRGLFFQYFEASLSLIFGFDEATLRYGSIFFNLLTIPGLYFLGRSLGGRWLGLTAVGIFSISLVEIEMSRYIRMYTAFQCLFVWYVLIQVKVITEKDGTKIKWLYIIALCSIFVHEGAIFPVLLLFLPLLFEFPGEKKRHIFISLAILIVTYFYLTFDFRHFGTIDHLPQDYQKIIGVSKILLPNLYFVNTIIETKGWLLAYGVILLTNIFLLYRIWHDTGIKNSKKYILTLLLMFGMIQMFGAILLLLFGSLISDKVNRKDLGNRRVRIAIGCLGLTLSFWILYGIFTDLWVQHYPYLFEISEKKVLVVLFKYPNIFDTFIFPWRSATPSIFTGLFFSLLYILLLRVTKKESGDSPLCV